MIHTIISPCAHTHKHTPCVPPCRSVGRLAGSVCLFLSFSPTSPSLPDRVSPRARSLASSPLHPWPSALGHATPAARRCIRAFHGEPPLGIVRTARRSARVCHRLRLTSSSPSRSLSNCSRSSRSRSSSRTPTHAYIVPSFSLPLLLLSPLYPLSLSLPLSPPSPAVPSFFPLFLLLSESDGEGNVSPAVSRLSPPRAVRRLLFFRLFVLASSRAGNRRQRRRLRLRRLPASRGSLLPLPLANRAIFPRRVAKTTKTRKALCVSSFC